MTKPASIEDIYPLSPLQAGMLFHTLLEPNSGVYFEQLTCELHGELDESAFARTWQLLAARHQILRTAFVWKGQREPVQVVHRKMELPWRREDWRDVDPRLHTEKLEAFLAEDRQRGFELNRAPLMRIATVRLADNVWQLVSSHHHILLDGWSFPLLLREFGEAYRAFCEGRTPALAPTRPFSSYLNWLQRRDPARTEAFWREELQGFSSPTPLPIDRGGRSSKQYRELDLNLTTSETARFQSAARDLRVTLNTLVQGAYALVLSRYCGARDVVFGVTVAGRPADLAGVENIVGLFINTVPLRVRVNPEDKASKWLATMQERQLAIQEFDYAGLADIQRWSDLAGGQALFESLLVFENYPIDAGLPKKLGGLEPREVRFMERTNYPLTMIAVPGDVLAFRASFDPARIDSAAVERLLRHVTQAMLGLADPDAVLGGIEITTPEERAQLLTQSARPAMRPRPAGSLHEWFEHQAARTPAAVALTDGSKAVSYLDLDRASNQVARRLQSLGVRPLDRVGLLLDRNASLVAGLLGILKAGATYVPLDPVYPDDRIAYMVEDSRMRAVVTQRSMAARITSAGVTALEIDLTLDVEDTAPLDVPITPEHPAYVIYTSGSTGRPKGCPITHANVLRLFTSTEAWFGFNSSDVWTLFHSVAFDFSVWEIWGALLFGGRLVIVPYYTSREPEAFYQMAVRERVTVLNQTPSAFRQFMQVEERQPVTAALTLRYVIFGGEALDLAALRPWFMRHGDARPVLVNMYGITETTVHVTYRPLTAADAFEARGSLIGCPLPDLQLVALDACGYLAPTGIPGELHVAGAGLSPGYLDRPELAAERFVPDPFALAPDGRLYRTGDLARRLPDGDFEYLGRLDHQVKIRGFRIELGEIESELSGHPDVRASVVIARKASAGETRLVAYLVARAGVRVSSDDLRAHLRVRLPEYMVPSAFVWLERLPLTPHGKVDRTALPEPAMQGGDDSGEHIAPRTDKEAALVEIWREVLGVPAVGIRDNYFALGGDSIRSLAIRSRARDKGIEFSLQDLFEKQTIESLISTAPANEQQSSAEAGITTPFSLISSAARTALPADVEDAYPLTRLQLGMLFHSHQRTGSSQYLDSFSFHLRGPLDRAALQHALDGLLDRHAILRTSFDLTALPEPLQLVHRDTLLSVHWADLSMLPTAAQESVLDELIRAEAGKAFDWTQAPLLRAQVHRRSEDTFQFTLTAHHAILDGWSVASLLTELFQDYLRRVGLGGHSPARLLSPAFSDFVALERAASDNPESRRFWTTVLDDAPLLSLPAAMGPASTDSNRFITLNVDLPSEVGAGLMQLAERLAIPLKSLLLTAHVRVLSLIGAENDVVTGLVSNGRPEASGAERLAGLFLNTLPFRMRLPHGTWAEAATAVFHAETAMLPHRRVPLAEIQKLVGTGALFHTDFNFVNFHIFDSLRGMDALQLVGTRSSEETNFALAVNFSLDGAIGGPRGTISADLNAIDSRVAAALPGLYQTALTAMALTPDVAWRETVLTSGVDRARMAASWKETAGQRIEEPLLHELVEAQVYRSPDAVAVVDARSSLTYRELDGRANQLAHWLIARGVRPDDRVGMAMERSTGMVVALFGILKAGAAYVPIDPDYPAQRIATIIGDSNARLVLADHADHDGFVRLSEIWPEVLRQSDETPNLWIWPESAAYVLYTSGSTGAPKGVVVPHMAVANHMEWMQREFPLRADDVVLQKTPVTFDASVWEFWAPLAAGARLAMADPKGHRDPAYLAEAVRNYGVTTLQLVPSVLDFFLDHATGLNCPSLRRMFAGGEALRRATRDRFYRNFKATLVNLYGPTECTIDATFEVCAREGEIGIGRPVGNMYAYVLDENLEPVPPGVPGELYLGGAGLARGYIGQPALTADRFLPDPWAPWPGMRIYRTGDRVRQRSDVSLAFVGRVDDQIKIRGHRVEPGEIEAVLASAPEVERALVLASAKAGDRQQLVAYVVPRAGVANDHVTVEKLFAFVRGRVPAALVPAHIVILDRIPVSVNGKVDRRALPSPDSGSMHRRSAPIPPSTPVEAQLAEMWKKVLGLPEVGVQDNFFELGGDSIQSLRLVSIAAQAGWRLRPKQIFDHPTIAALSRLIERNTAPADGAEAVEVDPENIPLLPVQREFFSLAAPNPHHWNQAVLVETPAWLSAEAAERAWVAVTSRHPAFRLRFAHERAGWRQYLADNAGCVFWTGSPDQLAEEASRAHASIDISRGPLACSVFFPGRWLFVAHHLCMDGVSWRVLLEELALAMTDDLAALPAEELSFAAWAVRLQQEDNGGDAPYWQSVTAGELATIPLDFPEGRACNIEAECDSVNWSLDEAETARLLRELPVSCRCRVEELLLTALGASLQEWSGSPHDMLVDLEGHGREEALQGGELSQTIGWFTSVYPVRLAASTSDDVWERLRAVKQSLREVPRGGIGYGLIPHAARADVSFNYLGQIDLALSAGGPFRPASESTGLDRDPHTPRARLLDVVAMVSGGRLRVQWLYSRATHRSETIEAAARRFGMTLRYLLTGAALDNAQAAVASDFPLADLDGDAVVQLLEASAPVADIWPLTPLQEGILVHALHDGDAGVYGQQVAVDLHGALDRQALYRAWAELARRHEMLRVEFRWRDLPGPRQVVQREIPVEMDFLDWSMYSAASQDRRWKEWLGADRARGFNLACVPLWRVNVIRLGDDRWRLVWTHHHLLLDGWSLPVVFRQLLELYAGAPAAEPPFNYRDYLAWLGRRDTRGAAAFWKEYLAGHKPSGALEIGTVPTASPRDIPARRSQRRDLSPEATRALRNLAQELQITVGVCIQAVWAVALARWTRQADVVFGLVVSGRPPELPGVESAVGMFINTLPLRVHVPRRETVGEWLRDLHRQLARLRQFESSRLVDIQSWSEIPRGQSLFEALLIIENYPLDEVLGDGVAGIRFGKVETFEQTNLPLNLYAVPGRQLELRIEYDTARFFDEPVGALADSVRWLLESLPSRVAAPVQTLTLLPPQSLETNPRTPIGDLIHRRVSEWAARTPERIAVAGMDGSLSYAELEARSNQLAHRLRSLGAGRGKLIGIRLDRSPDMVIALLGVLKAGAAYLPMDPAFPAERLAMMEADSGVGHVLTSADLEESALAAHSAEPLACDIDSAELAYVIFTSGSTGRPKGVQVTHGALANFLTHFAASPGLSTEDVLLAVTTLSFDIAGLELFLPLVCGAQVAICPREIAADARGLASALFKSSATVMQATPATWRLLLTGDWRPGSGFRAWCGGEALPMDLAASLLDRGVTLWNFYGPTETTIWSTTQPVREKPDAAFIGVPIANTLAYLLDDDLNPVPDGMPGELYLGGEGLARGYIGRPDLTAERFIPNPFGQGDRLYATGDTVRREPGGRLRFLGRGDHQVKIRGFRIELEEIEVALHALPYVRAAAAAAREDRIVAYVVGLTEAGGAVSLRGQLRDRLPDYMLPAAFVELDALPLTPNGKLDRRSLPDPGGIETAGADFIAPRNAIEQVLADLWRELLGLSKAGAHDHFFERGGHSLLAAQALARISKYFQVELSLRTFFQTATPESVAAALTAVEPKAGHMLKIAAALLKIRSMSAEERARLRERGTAVSAGG